MLAAGVPNNPVLWVVCVPNVSPAEEAGAKPSPDVAPKDGAAAPAAGRLKVVLEGAGAPNVRGFEVGVPKRGVAEVAGGVPNRGAAEVAGVLPNSGAEEVAGVAVPERD